MSVTRKILSLSSLGVVKSKSPKERLRLAEADLAKAQADAVRQQTRDAKAARKQASR